MSRLGRSTWDNTKVANTISCTFIFKQVLSAFGASSELVFTIAWVKAVNSFAIAWVNHHVARVLDVAESTVDCSVVYSIDVELIVEF